MSKRERIKQSAEKMEISGSETIFEKFKSKTPWIFGKKIKKPKIIFPKITSTRISLPTPSKALGLAVIYAILFVLQTGVVYLMYRETPALGADSAGDPIFIYPGIHESFIVEGIVASILIFVASTGFLLLYQASKHSYNKSLAIRIMIIGTIMILVAYVSLQYMIAVKLGETPWWE
jgi:hypothetical protein